MLFYLAKTMLDRDFVVLIHFYYEVQVMAISPTVTRTTDTRTTDCTHCGEINDAKRSSCNLCGSMLSTSATASELSFSNDMSNLSEEDRRALMGYAEIAQLSPVATSTQGRSQQRSPYRSAPPQMDVNQRPFGLKAMQMSGVAAFAMGLFFCSGNLFGFYPTVPFLGYLSMLIGGALWHSATHISD